ncbi:mpv17-like protein isoform X2 [Condylostylus longicornis]|uniref:mpv17-like protein isoform X2 n=1 Tax=Condylostylus longicornis TaxID=2530218 RepID=UPI00244D9FAE|nr:mpv17-like protein isoform X2 [Condylostylus longicornis]
MGIFRNIARLYTGLVERHPYITQALQVSLLMGTGDIIAQRYVEKTQISEINKTRTLQFCAVGLFGVGPCLRAWYGILDRVFLKEVVYWKLAIKKVCVDQLIFAPMFIGLFTITISIIQGLNNNEIRKRFENEYIDIVLTNYKVWPAAQLVNFAFIPLNYQVLFVQFIAILWNTYLSTKLKHQEKEVKYHKH